MLIFGLFFDDLSFLCRFSDYIRQAHGPWALPLGVRCVANLPGILALAGTRRGCPWPPGVRTVSHLSTKSSRSDSGAPTPSRYKIIIYICITIIFMFSFFSSSCAYVYPVFIFCILLLSPLHCLPSLFLSPFCFSFLLFCSRYNLNFYFFILPFVTTAQ